MNTSGRKHQSSLAMNAFGLSLVVLGGSLLTVSAAVSKVHEGSVSLLNPTSGPPPPPPGAPASAETSSESPYVNTEELIQQSARQIEEAIEKFERKEPSTAAAAAAAATTPPSSPSTTTATAVESSSVNFVIETTTESTKPMKEKPSSSTKKVKQPFPSKKSLLKKNSKAAKIDDTTEQISGSIKASTTTVSTTSDESIGAKAAAAAAAVTPESIKTTLRGSGAEAATTPESLTTTTTTTATTTTTTTASSSSTTIGASPSTTASSSSVTPSKTSPTSASKPTTTEPESTTTEDDAEVGPECVSKVSLAAGFKYWRPKNKNILNLTLATDNLSCSISAGLSVSSNTTSHLVLDAQVGDQIRLFVDEVDDDAVVTLHRSQEEALTECVEPPHGSVVWNRSQNFLIEADLLTQSGLQFFAVAVQSDSIVRVWHIRISVYDSECESRKESGELCSGRGVCALAPGESTYACHCCQSIKGRTCDEYDACAVNPCRNKGFCVDISEGLHGNLYQCLCPHAFRGTNCEENADFCEMHHPCKNNATCVSAPANATGTPEYACECQKGFEGPNCEVNIDECESKPCVHGMCEDGVGEFKCYCLPGYGGELCEFEYDECDSSPCVNNGACEDLIAGYKCHCGPGYSGRRCEMKIDLCKPNPCSAPATCIDRGNNYTCVCRGSGCATRDQQDPCYPNPCQHGGSCWPSMDTFYCSCPPGFAGDNCEEIAYPQAIAERRVYNPDESRQPSSERLHSIYVACASLAGVCALVALVVTVCQCRINSKLPPNDQLDPDCERLKNNSGHLRGPALQGDKLCLPWQRF